MDIKLKKKDTWSGKYRGLDFEIVNWNKEGLAEYYIKDESIWNYYVWFTNKSVSAEVFSILTNGITKTKYGWDYYSSPVSHLEWHGGATYGEEFKNEFSEYHAIKIGCDYNHYWDEGNTYDLEDLLRDVKNTIDNFHETYPNAGILK